MLESALVSTDFFICQVEKDRAGPSYTIDTLHQLNEQFGEKQYYFIIGSDAFAEIYTWKKFEQLTIFTNLLVINRAGCPTPLHAVITRDFPQFIYNPQREYWCSDHSGGIYQYTMDPVAISSTLIRDKVKNGEDISRFVPESVANYIHQHGLYKS